MILAGDIGGTKTNLSIYELIENKYELKYSQKFVSNKYNKFSDIISEFLEAKKDVILSSACFGIAGAVVDGECKTTNLPWDVVSIKELQNVLKISKVALLNDLAATAYGMLYLKDDELIQLNPNAIKKDATKCVIAAGTGLGEAILYHDGIQYHPMPTEGGHSDFATQNELEDTLLKDLRKKYPEHVSCERILCGKGIYEIYEFLKDYTKLQEPKEIIEANKDIDISAIISKLALEKSNELCIKTLEVFCKLYGAEAGNLALKSLSIGGVFIGGGIAPKILPLLQNGIFIEAFIEKGRFKDLLKKMEVKISLNQETAIIGAMNFAKDKLI